MKPVRAALRLKVQTPLLLSLLLLPAVAGASVATMNDYCVVPAFIGENVPANLLLMIDNSSSMYDLTYSDQGQTGHCYTTTSKACQSSADCPVVSGTTHESCVNGRPPYYCFDETYKSNVCSGDSTVSCSADTDCATNQTCLNVYTGYFKPTTFYAYDTTNHYFVPSSYDSTKCTGSMKRANVFCVGTDSSNQLTYFGASGNYLNWISSSKFDVEKGILTGGKVVSNLCTGTDKACNSNDDCTSGTCDPFTVSSAQASFVQAESRGCLGQGYAKIALTSDFVNYPSSDTDPNTQSGVVFLVKGPKDSDNPSAPSRGGQTYIEIYYGTAGVNTQACQSAIDAWAAGDKQGMSDYSSTCIGYNTTSNPNYCYSNHSRYCPNNTAAECIVSTPASIGGCNTPTGPNGTSCWNDSTCGTTPVLGNCSNQSKSCSQDSDCMIGGSMGSCSNVTRSCTQASDCTVAAVNGTCSAGTNKNRSCTSDSNCPTAAVLGACSNYTHSCTANGDCNTTEVMGTCSVGGTTCRTSSNCAGYCSNNPNKSCTGIGTACAGSNGTCTADTCSGYIAPTGTCSGYTPAGTAACTGYQAGSTGSCTGYVAGSTGTCDGAYTFQNTCSSPAPVLASTVDYGPCVNPTQSLVVKTKVAYTHTINTCAQYLTTNSLGSGDVTNFENGGDCVNVYGAGVCSNAPTQGCANDSDCGSGNTCIAGPGVCIHDNNQPCASNSDCPTDNICTKGPASILSGNAALICSNNYLGAYYTGEAPNWPKNAWSSDMAGQIDAFERYCAAVQPTVIDPTSAVTTGTSSYEQTPALLGAMGVEGQLGKPMGTIPVRLNVPGTVCTKDSQCPANNVCNSGKCAPSGLIQQFGNRIRIGAMSFNFNGSATEAGVSGTGIVTPMCCSNDTSKLCSLAADCGGSTCSSSYCNNKDAGQMLYSVGLGKCSTLTTTQCGPSTPCSGTYTCINGFCGTKHSTDCATNASCDAGDVCVMNGPGDHNSGLVNTMDRIRANAWTPFGEAFYDAIGYFAVQKQCDNSSTLCKFDSDCGSGGHCSVSTGKSRTDLRINSGDYDENFNPSQFPCQQNYVLLITDGSSTADRNPNSSVLATRNSVLSSTPAGQCNYFAGSTYLPTLTWLGRHMNIGVLPAPSGSPPTVTQASVVATQGRDSVTTYVVNTGGSNGQTGECESRQLLSDTASNGGSTIKQANNPKDLSKTLESVFEELAAKSASGTAASILSNSEGSGANILQAIFFPRKVFDSSTEAFWVGELNNLWYFVDPFIGKSSTREDTDGDYALKLTRDYVLQFGFDNVKGETTVKILKDSDGDGTGDTNPSCVGTDPRCVINPYPTMDADPNAVYLTSPDAIKSLWKAGNRLWQRDLTATAATDPYGGARTIYSVHGDALTPFSYASPADNSATFASDLQYPGDAASAKKLMMYIHGFDYPGDDTWRSRTVKIGNIPGPTVSTDVNSDYVKNPRDKGKGVWKLGDIISSTPRVQSTLRQNGYNLGPPSGYLDSSYGDAQATTGYIGTSAYKHRGMVYVGANDGMLHAFKLGILNVAAAGDQKATLSNNTTSVDGTGLGNEAWAFIPQNSLPYLKYYADPNYSHLYFLDGNNTVVDASVAKPASCSSTDYWDCDKDFSTGTGSNWRSILVGGMGIGGASRNVDDGCVAGTGGTCVKTPIDGVGYSSYYALDVTTPGTPQFLWEFSDAVISDTNDRGLGFATSGPAIVKINASGGKGKNGRWFAVFGSGPTGPIDTDGHKFMGTSNQQLKVYVVDLNARPPFVKGTNYWVLSDVYTGTTGSGSTVASATPAPLTNAFAGSFVNGTIDADRWNPGSGGNYQDDAVYFGYSQKDPDHNTWTQGGILKLVTSENIDPSTWKIVKVMDTPGPVTTGIARLQDRKNHKLWLYFGTGRYYYMLDDFSPTAPERLYGIQDLCYRDGMNRSGTSAYPIDSLDPGCATLTSGLTDQTSADQTTVTTGWYIALDAAHSSDPDPSKVLGAERSITDPVAMTNGAVFFSTYKPNNDFCQFGGVSYMWAVKYDTGTQAPTPALQGKALVQVSTGQFKEVDLSTAFTDKYYRRMSDQNAMTGKPPSDSPPIVSKSNNKPVRRILHMQER